MSFVALKNIGCSDQVGSRPSNKGHKWQLVAAGFIASYQSGYLLPS
jgi:hypothetical protein